MPKSKVAAVLAALTLAVPLVASYEGLRLTPYADPGDGRKTVCFGETEREMRRYTEEECSVLLIARLASDYAPPVIKCVPGLADRPNQLASAMSFSYNVGVGAFCRSTAARRFNAGDWRGGCEAYMMWVKTGGRTLPGLVKRRAAERSLCLRDL